MKIFRSLAELQEHYFPNRKREPFPDWMLDAIEDFVNPPASDAEAIGRGLARATVRRTKERADGYGVDAQHEDCAALAADWAAVGGDIWAGIEQYERQT